MNLLQCDLALGPVSAHTVTATAWIPQLSYFADDVQTLSGRPEGSYGWAGFASQFATDTFCAHLAKQRVTRAIDI